MLQASSETLLTMLLGSVVVNRCPGHLFFSPAMKGIVSNGSGEEGEVTALLAGPVNYSGNCWFPGTCCARGITQHDGTTGWIGTGVV